VIGRNTKTYHFFVHELFDFYARIRNRIHLLTPDSIRVEEVGAYVFVLGTRFGQRFSKISFP
jgi:hypothetical protein